MKTINQILNIDVPIILASRSPRRHKLLSMVGLEFTTKFSDIDEEIDTDIPPEAYCIHLAWSKADVIASKLVTPALVIGADTIVVIDGMILNKPADRDDAYRILKLLSGNTHTVYTGLSIVDAVSRNWITDFQTTEVTFRELSDEEIWLYIESGSPMDKAGAYGIQDDFGALFVSHINGCYYNIVGLPVQLLYIMLKRFRGENAQL
ncbi:MAG: septum formation protein Maf [Desulfobulbaceae bacterium]|nr:septum formation protein Maf [Candidatus Kapabacteria bacterium]MBS4001045.1 septum formation protein Maf [Desulfobulbaceae bacterium]